MDNMTSHVNLEEIYSDIKHLLKDVCSFLTTEVENGTLSPAAHSEAQKLVNRSLKQIELVSVVTKGNSAPSSPYLQMQGPHMLEESLSEYVDADANNHYDSDVYEESYDQIDHKQEIIRIPQQAAQDDNNCPYSDLPIHAVQDAAIKCGPLQRKERYLFIEKKSQIYVGLVGYWLLVYSIKKDAKPSQTLNLTDCTALIVEQKKDPTFEITAENKKSYEFITRTFKELDQWVTAINCKKQISINTRNLPNIPVTIDNIDSCVDTDKISNNNTNLHECPASSTEEIYENLDEINSKRPPSIPTKEIDEKSPVLPPRQAKYFNHTFNANSKENKYNNVTYTPNGLQLDDEEDDTYDPVQNGDSEEEDAIYDELRVTEQPVLIKRRILPDPEPEIKNCDNEEDEDDSYDIPRIEHVNNAQFLAPQTQNDNVYEDEDVEYDELKILPQNEKVNTAKESNNFVIKVDDEKTVVKPVITSPKPKLNLKLNRISSFSQQSEVSSEKPQQDSPQGKESSKRIHNIIQQMEASLSFKGTKN